VSDTITAEDWARLIVDATIADLQSQLDTYFAAKEETEEAA
jgi:hypothetical protein